MFFRIHILKYKKIKNITNCNFLKIKFHEIFFIFLKKFIKNFSYLGKTLSKIFIFFQFFKNICIFFLTFLEKYYQKFFIFLFFLIFLEKPSKNFLKTKTFKSKHNWDFKNIFFQKNFYYNKIE